MLYFACNFFPLSLGLSPRSVYLSFAAGCRPPVGINVMHFIHGLEIFRAREQMNNVNWNVSRQLSLNGCVVFLSFSQNSTPRKHLRDHGYMCKCKSFFCYGAFQLTLPPADQDVFSIRYEDIKVSIVFYPRGGSQFLIILIITSSCFLHPHRVEILISRPYRFPISQAVTHRSTKTTAIKEK